MINTTSIPKLFTCSVIGGPEYPPLLLAGSDEQTAELAYKKILFSKYPEAFDLAVVAEIGNAHGLPLKPFWPLTENKLVENKTLDMQPIAAENS